MSLPPRLYKYESFTAQSLQNLKSQVIYFGSPLKFNDPYDCALSPSIKEPSNAEIEKIRQHYLANRKLTEEGRRELALATTANLRIMFLRIGQDTLDQAIAKFLSRRGVSCFSEKVDSLLMWSHYGEHCKGFCLEFDTSTEPFQKIKKVRYAQGMPVFDVVPLLCGEDFDPVLDLYCTKAIDWAYEHKWRGIHNQVGTAFGYPGNALTGFTSGPICRLLHLRSSHLSSQARMKTFNSGEGHAASPVFLSSFSRSPTPHIWKQSAKDYWIQQAPNQS